jgi:hypothetical protein
VNHFTASNRRKMDVTTCWNCSLIVPTIPQHATLWVRLDGPTQFVNSSEAGKKVLKQNKSQSASSKHSLHLWQAELTAAVKSLYQLLSKMKSKSQSPFYLAPNYCHFTTTAISSCFPGGWFSMAGFSHPSVKSCCRLLVQMRWLTYVQRNMKAGCVCLVSGCTFVSVRRNMFAISHRHQYLGGWRIQDGMLR